MTSCCWGAECRAPLSPPMDPQKADLRVLGLEPELDPCREVETVGGVSLLQPHSSVPRPSSPLPCPSNTCPTECVLSELCRFVHQSVSFDEPGSEAHTYHCLQPHRNLLWGQRVLSAELQACVTCHQTGGIKTGKEQAPKAHMRLWAVFPGPQAAPHGLPVPLITQ